MFPLTYRSALTVLLLILLGSLVPLAFQGCATETTLADLKDRINTPNDLWTGTYYCGTKDGFHYFKHTRMLVTDPLLRIDANELDIPNPMKYPQPRSKWVSVEELGLVEHIPPKVPKTPAQ